MLKKFTIDRAKWRTGGAEGGPRRPGAPETPRFLTGEGDTQLLNEEGFMCCLGFFSLSCGYSEEEILNKGEPEEMDVDYDGLHRYPDWFAKVVSDGDYYEGHYDRVDAPAQTQFIEVNDNPYTTPQQKEELVKDLFATHGVEVEFFGEYVVTTTARKHNA